MRKKTAGTLTNVFYWTLGILIVFVAIGILFPSQLEAITATVRQFIANFFGWYYLIVVTIFLLVCLFFIVSPFGRLRLGKEEDRPEYSYLTWFAFLFSAGLGVGLLFFGAAEPIAHYAIDAPTADEATGQAALESLKFVFLHWGFHGWAIYAIVAICLAYFNFRKDMPGLISATLSPLINPRGFWGQTIDVIAIVATLSGIATTLGFGAAQMNGGISFLTNIPNSFGLQLVIIVIVTILFLISASTGIDKGIRVLSRMNMILVMLMLLFFMIFGASLYSLNLFTNTLGQYIQSLPELSFTIAPNSSEHREWINAWTLFYWAWWMAWSPYVGTFIARVSRGRTLREFVIGVLLVPSLLGFVWFSFLGGTAISFESQGLTTISNLADEEALFGVLGAMPFSTITSYITIFLIAVFFITSADSATHVLGSQSTNGSLNPPTKIKILWGVLMSATAAVLLYSGGLQGLQNTMIVVAFPFSIIMLLMVISLFKALRHEQLKKEVKERRLLREIAELRQFKSKTERAERKRHKQEEQKQKKTEKTKKKKGIKKPKEE
ncbi:MULTISPECIES: BCCT family transporter [Shouchella]|uniref:BCCT family transporter n=2 Tax=Shouchella TaxID=2893057 RepID=A0ABY7W545_9BACI|nr:MULTISPECIES: BCCT family transporter [Shouchella]MED4130686.1 BCCT family transporter [Shouchella miscanthi]WDF02982.1 BCCT family transporter [Shouchella hunanensis]GAF24538.1 glycine betaine transporter OpuD [Bacillus sp. JCM 19047]